MTQKFDIPRAPQTPLRAERAYPMPPLGHLPSQQTTRVSDDHIRGVEGTPGGLLRSTLVATGAAVAVLTVFYLPAEYGVDPTGLGGVLGLTEMGLIKQQLYAEDAADAAANAAAPVVALADPTLLARLDAIEAQIAAVAAVVGADISLSGTTEPQAAPDPAPTVTAQPGLLPEVVAVAPEPLPQALPEAGQQPPRVVETPAVVPEWRDEVSYTLAPGEGIEVKLAMEEGQVARFAWTANGSVVNFDAHGDGNGNSISYEQGRGVPEQSGELTAAFTGNHGWFWRNRTDAPVTLTLLTSGEYIEMRAP
jgi:hypothetical protein